MMRAQFKQYTDVPVNNVTYNVIKLLGKGKGGYSYLAQRDGRQYVIKQIHHEPCDYYTFGKSAADGRGNPNPKNARY